MMLESYIWLFLVAFTLHEFEEILTMERWLGRHRALLEQGVPKWTKPMVDKLMHATTPVYTAIIMEEFILIALATLIIVEMALFDFFAAVVVAYLIHLLIHGVQAIYLKRYVPGLLFGVLSGIYGAYVLTIFGRIAYVDWSKVRVMMPIIFIVIVLNLAGGHWFAGRLFPPTVGTNRETIEGKGSGREI